MTPAIAAALLPLATTATDEVTRVVISLEPALATLFRGGDYAGG